jgi:Derlin-2/3
MLPSRRNVSLTRHYLAGFWLPFISLGIMTLTGQGLIAECLLGIAVGHLWYFCTILMPRAGQTVLPTPRWVRTLAVKMDLVAPAPAQARAQPNPSDARFRAFSGRARRLA